MKLFKDDAVKIENDSYSIINNEYEDLVSQCKLQGWSFAYAQLSLNEFRYSLDKNQ